MHCLARQLASTRHQRTLIFKNIKPAAGSRIPDLPDIRTPLLSHNYATDPGRRPGFFESFIDNLKKEYSENKDMKDSLTKFREEAKKLEESDALKDARRKFQNIEGESSKTKSAFR